MDSQFPSPSVNLPRVSMHAFVTSDGVKALLEAALQDRRLSNLNASILAGGIQGAVERYSHEPTPTLLIIDGGYVESSFFEGLDALAEVCDPNTRLIVVGKTNDIEIYRELIGRGVKEYLVVPFTVSKLIQSIMKLFAEPAQRAVGRSVAVIGAKGGVGSSSVAHNMAWSLSQRSQAETVLVDFDLAFGTAGLSFDQDPPEGVATALNAPDRMDATLAERLMVRCSEHFSLFTAPLDLDTEHNADPSAYQLVIDTLKSMAPQVILDLPHLWTPWLVQTLICADEIVVVVGCDLASLRNANSLFDFLRRRRPNDPAPRLVINQVGISGRTEIPAAAIAKALEVEPSATIPFDGPLFSKATLKSAPLAALNPKARAVTEILGLIESIGGFDASLAKKAPRASALMQAIRKNGLANVWKAA